MKLLDKILSGAGSIAKGAVRVAKEKPELALAVAGAVAPKLVRKVAPVLVAVLAKKAD